jgi:citrate synthase
MSIPTTTAALPAAAPATPPDDARRAAEDWWTTRIIDMSPGVIRYRGYPIEDLIRERVGLAQMIWLLTRGELPTKAQGDLLEVALMSAVDHGPQAPSIAIARMAATCGVGLNSAMASAVNVLGDVHGGAGEQAVELYQDIASRIDAGADEAAAVADGLAAFVENHGKVIPGFGHRFHPVDPRTAPLLECVDAASAAGEVGGRYARIARAVEAQLSARKGKPIPMNIDGATAVIYAELGFPAPLARGLFCLSRSVGILAHAWEQTGEGVRIKGPIPKPCIPTYAGPAPRTVSRGFRESRE